VRTAFTVSALAPAWRRIRKIESTVFAPPKSPRSETRTMSAGKRASSA